MCIKMVITYKDGTVPSKPGKARAESLIRNMKAVGLLVVQETYFASESDSRANTERRNFLTF